MTHENTLYHLEPDLNVAAYLLTRGFPLVRLERVGRRFALAFEHSPQVQATAQEFRHGATAEARAARDFANACKRLKDEIYSAKFQETQYFSEKFKDENGNGIEGHEQ